jgi:hypothetical protein
MSDEEAIKVSKQYLETARTLSRIARNMADQKVADRLKAPAGRRSSVGAYTRGRFRSYAG